MKVLEIFIKNNARDKVTLLRYNEVDDPVIKAFKEACLHEGVSGKIDIEFLGRVLNEIDDELQAIRYQQQTRGLVDAKIEKLAEEKVSYTKARYTIRILMEMVRTLESAIDEGTIDNIYYSLY